MIGTFVNIAAVLIGSSIGLLIHKKLPGRLVQVTFQIMGLFTLVLGMKMALESENLLVMVFSLIIGGLIGTAFHFDDRIQKLSGKLTSRFGGKNENFAKGLITAFLLFCVGSMTIVGALEEGMNDDPSLLLMKSLMDGFSSIALSVAFGIGVMFSVIPLLIFQGGLTLLAMYLGSFLPTEYITEISAVGGVILLGLGMNLLEITKIKIIDLLPAILLAPFILWVWGFVG
ncbi:MAG: DUF554 family protein [Bacteroidales bacterium]|nr:DUF554 family protein [Bacteroidales bacterium]